MPIARSQRIRARSSHRARSGDRLASRLYPEQIPYLQMYLTFSEIGDRLFISRNTVNKVGSMYRKLAVSSRRDAVQHHLCVQEQLRTRNGNCAS
jgi:DNA-binding NarL/FixJ family response regulator